ncbi:hypothetical protein [Sinorhizobium medicae]|uniref:hypothetical protein n=1 Tax=Sinorhizobium medicae TaxID=110321 RepID=UPI0012969A6C|nr:hypothetical protein [Sinorhizobium medicae]MQX45739.1 hypothetical protein [Sinorhizobium medicae]
MKKLALMLVATVAAFPAKADFIDTTWSVVGWTGEAWYIDTNSVIGKTQRFYKGEAEGVFYQCSFQGQSATYTTYDTVDEFLANPEFKLFKPAEEALRLSGPQVFVHRITCEGDGNPENRRVLYPFVTTQKRHSAYYIFEGGFFSLYTP